MTAEEEQTMNAGIVVLQGVVKPDGTLELEGRIPLPAGKVQVTLQPVPDLPEGDPFFDMLKGIWAARAAAGLTPHSVAEVEAQRQQLREETEQKINEAIRLQEESQRLREEAEGPERGRE
jgi:hypothetical protein